MALKPIRFKRDFPSGSSARREATGLVPIARFHASVFGARCRLAENPTPIVVVFVCWSEIIVVINQPPKINSRRRKLASPPTSSSKTGASIAVLHYRHGWGVLIGLSY